MNNNPQSIDFEHLNTIVNNDENFRNELIGIFLEQIPVFVNNMKQFFEDNEMENLSREAHTAKSSVLIFGMKNAGRLLKEIQLLAENRKMSEIQPLLVEVVAEINHAEKQLLNILKRE